MFFKNNLVIVVWCYLEGYVYFLGRREVSILDWDAFQQPDKHNYCDNYYLKEKTIGGNIR